MGGQCSRCWQLDLSEDEDLDIINIEIEEIQNMKGTSKLQLGSNKAQGSKAQGSYKAQYEPQVVCSSSKEPRRLNDQDNDEDSDYVNDELEDSDSYVDAEFESMKDLPWWISPSNVQNNEEDTQSDTSQQLYESETQMRPSQMGPEALRMYKAQRGFSEHGDCSEHEKRSIKTKKINKLMDVNTATQRQLRKLPGVGDALALRIINGRPYMTVDQLLGVSGIGKSKLNGFQDLIMLNVLTSMEKLSWNAFSIVSGNQVEDQIRESVRNVDLMERFNAMNLDNNNTVTSSSNDKPILLMATWNVRHLSKKKSVQQLERICKIMEEYDLVALQEVRDLFVLKRMRGMLSGWDFVASPPVGRGLRNIDQSIVHEEIYAFFYRKSQLKLRGIPCCIVDVDDRFVREPFMAQFAQSPSSSFPPFDFVCVNIHVVFGRKIDRKGEIKQVRHLIQKIDEVCADKGEVILMGDFNMPPRECAFEHRVALVQPPLCTTIFNSLYDNIYLTHDLTVTNQWMFHSGVHRIDWKFFPDTKKSAYKSPRATKARNACNKSITDHLPVWVAIQPTALAYNDTGNRSTICLSQIEYRSQSSKFIME